MEKDKKDKLIWIMTIVSSLLTIVSFVIATKSFWDNEMVLSKLDGLYKSFNYKIISAYIFWTIFIVLYIFVGSASKKWNISKDNDREEEFVKNYYGTLYVWGAVAIFVYHFSYVLTLEMFFLEYILPESINYVLFAFGFVIGLFGLHLVMQGRIDLDGFWGNHLYRYTGNSANQIVETGIYAKVRHPIYGGQVYLSISSFLLTGCLPLILFPVIIFLYNLKRANNEEKWLEDNTEKYIFYKNRVLKKIMYPF